MKKELNLIITNLEHFASCIEKKRENLGWYAKHDIIGILVKRVEINHEEVNIVFRISDLTICNNEGRIYTVYNIIAKVRAVVWGTGTNHSPIKWQQLSKKLSLFARQGKERGLFELFTSWHNA